MIFKRTKDIQGILIADVPAGNPISTHEQNEVSKIARCLAYLEAKDKMPNANSATWITEYAQQIRECITKDIRMKKRGFEDEYYTITDILLGLRNHFGVTEEEINRWYNEPLGEVESARKVPRLHI